MHHPEDDSASTAEEVPEPGPYIVPEEDPPVPDRSAAEVEAAIADALVFALRLNGTAVFPAYLAAMEGADETCPTYLEQDGNVYWYDVCTSSDGSQFSGYTFYAAYDHEDVGGGTVYTGHAMSGAAEVLSADGSRFEGGGTAYDLRIDGDGYTQWYSVAQGAFSSDGPAAAGTWLEDGLSPDLIQSVYYVPHADAKAYELVGSVAGLGGGFSTAVFDGFILPDRTLAGMLGSNCWTEPGGTVSVRDEDGGWYDVIFDGYRDERPTTPAGECDGCGAAYFGGEPLGEVCVDFTGLNTWEGAPW